MTENAPKFQWSLRSLLFRSFLALVILVGVLISALPILSATNLLRTFNVPTRAMTPTITPGDLLFMEGFSYRFRNPQRGEIVVFDTKGLFPAMPATDTPIYFVFRVVGLPGDTVEIKEPRLFINDEVAEEVAHIDYQGTLKMEVPPEKYFVLGDNSWNSYDSRDWGLLPAENIVGRICFRYWPPSRSGEVDRGQEIRGPQPMPAPIDQKRPNRVPATD